MRTQDLIDLLRRKIPCDRSAALIVGAALAMSPSVLGLGPLASGCSGSATVSTSSTSGGTDATNGGQSGGAPAADGTSTDTGHEAAPAAFEASEAVEPSKPPAGEVNVDWKPRTRARMLLSGHSLTDNPLADNVQAIAESRGRDYGWEQQIVIGSPLRIRTRGDDSEARTFAGYRQGKNREGSAKDLLRELASPKAIGASEHYDTLVVTDRADILDVITWEGTVPYLRHYHDRLRAYEPSARTLFYQTWPNINKAQPKAWIDYVPTELVAWECAASKVNMSLQADGLPQAVTVVPAGTVLARFVERALSGSIPGVTGSTKQRLDAIFIDNIHVTPLGSYVLSAAVYAAIFAESAAAATPPPDVNAAAAKAGAEIAWEVISEYNRAGHKPWLRPLDQCRKTIHELCPKYYAIEGRNPQCFEYWISSDSPLKWPDPSFPLPAP